MSVEKRAFGTMPDGRAVDLYIMKNAAGTTVEVMPYGCRLVKILVPDRNGRLGDVVVGHDTFEEYQGKHLLPWICIFR